MELQQSSAFAAAVTALQLKGVQHTPTSNHHRKTFLDRLSKFPEDSQPWTEFLLVNLMEEVRSNKKELLELRLMLSYGEAYLTSSVINLCEDELLDLTDNL